MLVAVFAFLMLTYRIMEGSATLGAMTLLTVIFIVVWILWPICVRNIPYNVTTRKSRV